MSLPEPRANPDLLGHAAAEATLAAALAAGRLHHAWLIAGPEGIGKATLAYRFARFLLAARPPRPDAGPLALDPADPAFRRVAAGAHADLMTIERGYDEKRKRKRQVIIVDDVRKLGGFMALTPAEGGWRVAIVDGAEEMNPAAANALLKILEEPPDRAVLLVTTAAPGRLLPTIRSRCRRLNLAALNEADMRTLLARALPKLDEAARDRLAALAEGSPGRALALAEADGPRLAGLVDRVLAALPDPPPGLGHEIADALGRGEGEGFGVFMDLLRASLAALVREAARGDAEPDQARLIGRHPLAAWGDVWQALTRLQDETESVSLDRRQAVLASLALLADPAQGLS
ncbi:MAG: DNA polymerase III subunit delta' [Rhodospirillales bacterium]|nr:DNA polymerase III subunit delta' [Rhodospirillales bacterium]